MCQADSSPLESSLLASALPQEPFMMPTNSTFSIGVYGLFNKESTFDVVSPYPILIKSSHLHYWLALGFVLVTAYILRLGKRKNDSVDAPFYKASKMKWMFDAENLVRDSYHKVYHATCRICSCFPFLVRSLLT
jgi:hypothetical protein